MRGFVMTSSGHRKLLQLQTKVKTAEIAGLVSGM